MASMVELSSIPRYCPYIRFANGEFFRKYLNSFVVHHYDPREVPNQAILRSGNKTVADFVPVNGRLAMCAEARAVIEGLEPGRHQFFPFEIVRQRSKKPIYRIDGRLLTEPYFLFNVQVQLEAVCMERSEVRVVPMSNNNPPHVHPLAGNYNIVLRKSVIGGHHVWKGGVQLGLELFFSDALVAAIEARGLRKLDFHQLMEV